MSFPGGSVVKNLPASAGDAKDVAQSLGWEDPLEKEMATHSSIDEYQAWQKASCIRGDCVCSTNSFLCLL